MKTAVILAKKLHKLIVTNQFILYGLVFLLIYYFNLWIQAHPTFLDPDSFYHLKISKLIMERGPVMDFPWLQFTFFKDYYIDHHFLYHVAMIPFIKLFGDFSGYKLGTVFLATGFLFFCYAFWRKFKLKYPIFFLLLMMTSAGFMFRLNLAKAPAFSLLLLFVGLYFLLRQKYWLLGVVAFIYVWSYDGFPLLLFLTLIYIFSHALYGCLERLKHSFKLKGLLLEFVRGLISLPSLYALLAVFGGIILGVIINPYWPQNLYFYYEHIIEIGFINYKTLITVGGEWYPYTLPALISTSGAILIILTATIPALLFSWKKMSQASLFFMLTTLCFLVLCLQSKRHIEYFIPFVAFFCAFAWADILKNINPKLWLQEYLHNYKRFAQVVIGLIIVIALLFPLIMFNNIKQLKHDYQGGYSFTNYQGAAEYIKKNSQAGEIVMTTDWDDFPQFFYYNDHNYYLVGLDPTFMYRPYPELYQLYGDITKAKKIDNLYEDISQKLRAKYFVVNNDREQLSRALLADGNFTQVYQDNEAKVFKVK